MAPICRHLSVFSPLCWIMFASRGKNWHKKVNFNCYPAANWHHYHCQKVSFVKFIFAGKRAASWEPCSPLQSNSSSYTVLKKSLHTGEKLSSDLSPMKITRTSNYFSPGLFTSIKYPKYFSPREFTSQSISNVTWAKTHNWISDQIFFRKTVFNQILLFSR